VRPDVSWQAKEGKGFDVSTFVINWEDGKATCPEGATSVDWTPTHDSWGNETIHIGFDRKICAACPSRSLCTHAKSGPREITLRPRPLHEALQNGRQQQETEAWHARYSKRAGIEGTLSQGVRAFGSRRSRYRGL